MPTKLKAETAAGFRAWLAQIEKLSPQERRQILQVLDALIECGQLKQKVQASTA